jgi:hypothetical protein
MAARRQSEGSKIHSRAIAAQLRALRPSRAQQRDLYKQLSGRRVPGVASRADFDRKLAGKERRGRVEVFGRELVNAIAAALGLDADELWAPCVDGFQVRVMTREEQQAEATASRFAWTALQHYRYVVSSVANIGCLESTVELPPATRRVAARAAAVCSQLYDLLPAAPSIVSTCARRPARQPLGPRSR